MNTKFNLEIASFKFINQIVEKVEKAKRDFRTHWNKQAEQALAKFFGWAFSFRAVQVAVVSEISCGTPIGRMLNDHIEQSVEQNTEVDVDDVRGLERYVEKEIENAFDNFKVDADNVDNLDRAIENATGDAVDEFFKNNGEDLNKQIKEDVIETIVEALQRG